MRLPVTTAAAICMLTVIVTATAVAAPNIPNSARAGREREQVLGKDLFMGPRIDQRPLWQVEPQPQQRQRQNQRRKCPKGRRC